MQSSIKTQRFFTCWKRLALTIFFGMAAMPFPCNGILIIQENLARVFPILTLNNASFPIPYLNFIYFIGNGTALSFNIFGGYFASFV